MQIRTVRSADYNTVSPLINDWWGGRQMSDMLPRLFFDHFNDTSFIAEVDEEVVGFLIGFLSQTYPKEAYIHFVGVHPHHRKQKIGRVLYQQFFAKAQLENCTKIRCVTSPVNKVSIAYHQRMGFAIESGDKSIDGIPVSTDYDGSGRDRVLFVKELI
ncbi:GNAT family N-acetyltransferase [Gracilibacillus alcaliphilus]|uniref:GNAT family N-acetyltransferase n=1 Tax=Gracilibacillus alcaliphilus TaxID=1401441 RepID=UPI001958272D|nr:GNAT family N-acetyltransferase [Gracilibacillus alcaliphilus]MBM7675721.1 ribosomal protein S18 acetylase RimI-like enzyme [Gracilibacillus alcaliphilus]